MDKSVTKIGEDPQNCDDECRRLLLQDIIEDKKTNDRNSKKNREFS